MLEGPTFLVARDLPSACEQESKWAYNAFCVTELSKGKRCLEDVGEATTGLRKSWKPSEKEETHAFCVTELSKGKRCLEDGEEATTGLRKSWKPSGKEETHALCVTELSKGKGCLEDGEEATTGLRKSWKPSEKKTQEGSSVISLSESDQSDNQKQQEDQSDNQKQQEDQSDSSSLINQIGRDLSINCLLLSSRSDYGSIASLNCGFRSLVRNGELYRLRRLMGIVEHWVYFLCNLCEWEAFDPIRRRWMRLPTMDCNECFMCSDKESLAVGTELLVFGKEIDTHVVYKYSILTNSWSPGMKTNTPRCLFGSASLGVIAIVAGGCGPCGNILSSAELYNSETGTWVTLPDMNKPRKMCSGVFMDSKFYVIGGIGEENNKELTCGEVYDLETGTWSEIPNMFPVLTGAGGQDAPATAKAPPLLAVVRNELYAAYYEEQEVRKYDKGRNLWIRVGGLPERASSMNGWGLAFRACGDQLIVIGGPRVFYGRMIELNSWVPDESPPQWNLLARKRSGGFVYNCAVMGC